MQDCVGKQIDRYRFTERLGMGGMAVIYKTDNTHLEQGVDIKFICAETVLKEEQARLLSHFDRAYRSQVKCSHPNIVSASDYRDVDSVPYPVIEYILEGVVKDLTGEKLDREKIVNHVIEIADAQDYAHRLKIILRGIKPINNLIDREGRPLFNDYDGAKTFEGSKISLTDTGLEVGAPEFKALEQLQGQTSTFSDQYAMSVPFSKKSEWGLNPGDSATQDFPALDKHFRDSNVPFQRWPSMMVGDKLGQIIFRFYNFM